MSAEFDSTSPEPITDSFANDLIAVYGEGGAYEIATSLLCSIDDALVNVPLLKPPDLTIRLGIDQDPYDHGKPDRMRAYVNSQEERVTIVLGSSALSGEIADLLFHAMHHEIGHIAHYQYNQSKDEFHESPFGAACSEGIAELAADQDFSSFVYWNDFTEAQATELARDELDKTLSGFYDEMGYHEFIFGDEKLHRRGYYIGAYVVSNLALREDVSLVEIMQSPLERFKDFAKAELL